MACKRTASQGAKLSLCEASLLDGKVLLEDERAELKRLRKEVKDLRIDKRMTTSLVSQALIKAYNLRQPSKGLVFHSDRGSQYTSKRYQELLVCYGMRASLLGQRCRWRGD